MEASTKKQLSKWLILFVIVLLSAVTSINVLLASEQEEATAVAAESLEFWLNVIPGQDLEGYGFSEPSQLEQATLAEPFQLHTIGLDEVHQYREQNILSVISPVQGRWLFPVLADGRYRTMLIVASMEGRFKAVGIGNAGLAQQLDAARARWPSEGGFRLRLVRVNQALSDFILLEDGTNEARLVPLESAVKALGLTLEEDPHSKISGQGLWDPQDPGKMMRKLKGVVQRHGP